MASDKVKTGVLEIERKFTIKSLPGDLHSHSSVLITQGYLAVDSNGIEVRLRRADHDHFLTIKHPADDARMEHEMPLSKRQWEELWPLTAGRRLTKTRFFLPHDGLTIELDQYNGANDGLVIGEVEFPDREAAAAFVAPSWFDEEVTGDAEYSNRRLAKE